MEQEKAKVGKMSETRNSENFYNSVRPDKGRDEGSQMRCKLLAPKQKNKFVFLFLSLRLKKTTTKTNVDGPSEGLLHEVQYSYSSLGCCCGPTSQLDTAKPSKNGFGFGMSSTTESSKTIRKNLTNQNGNCFALTDPTRLLHASHGSPKTGH